MTSQDRRGDHNKHPSRSCFVAGIPFMLDKRHCLAQSVGGLGLSASEFQQAEPLKSLLTDALFGDQTLHIVIEGYENSVVRLGCGAHHVVRRSAHENVVERHYLMTMLAKDFGDRRSARLHQAKHGA
jgi:hypothetical protein